jgi:hypothetical protein
MAYDPSMFESRRRGLTQQYGAESAMNEYARMLAQQRGSRSLGEFQRQVTKQIPQFGRSFGRKGLYGQGIKSGLFNRAIKEFGEEASRQQGYTTQDLADEQRQFQLREAQAKSSLEQSLLDLESEKARQIAESAQGLLSLR